MLVTMSDKEIHRLPVIQAVCEKRLRRRDAASQLGISERQAQRLINRYRVSGAEGLVSRKRGQPSNRRLTESLKLRVLTLIRENYSDFGPTIDGSHHDWFEGRAPKCCLLVFIDDATGRLMHLRFSESETAFDYMLATREYIEQHGKPVSLYSDKHAIFRVSGPEKRNTTVTQFGRVLYDLAIELICANSSEAKGRVERANQTLQDRLIKEMRLEGITGIEAANAWLATFIADFNSRFSRPAKFPKDLHRPVQESPDELRDIFAWHDVRTVSKSLTFQYDKILYLMDTTEENSRLAGEKIKVLDYPDGTLAFLYGHRSLKCQAFDKLACVDQGQIVDNKRLGTVLRLAQVKQDERESEGKRERSKKSPSRKAQVRIQEQLRAINPVLADPSLFVASSKR